jgi:hypothetical protein
MRRGHPRLRHSTDMLGGSCDDDCEVQRLAVVQNLKNRYVTVKTARPARHPTRADAPQTHRQYDGYDDCHRWVACWRSARAGSGLSSGVCRFAVDGYRRSSQGAPARKLRAHRRPSAHKSPERVRAALCGWMGCLRAVRWAGGGECAKNR